MEVLNGVGLAVGIQKLLNRGRELKSSKDFGNVRPVLSRNFGKTANAFDVSRFLKLVVIGSLFKREILKTLQVGLVLFPNSLVNGSGFGNAFRTLAENDLSASMLKDAIKWLFVNEDAIKGIAGVLVRHE